MSIEDLRDTAPTLLTKLGKSATYRKRTQGAFDPSTGNTSGASYADHAVKISPPAPLKADEEAPVTYQEASFIAYLADKGLAFVPDEDDLIVVDTVSYTVVGANPLYAGEVKAVWQLFMKG